MDERMQAIAALIGDYADGLWRADAALLGRIFLPSARYVTLRGGALVDLGMADYLAEVAARVPPRDRGEPCDFALEALDLAGPDTALARVRGRMMGRLYVDFLALLHVGGAWRIAAKTFHSEPLPAGS